MSSSSTSLSRRAASPNRSPFFRCRANTRATSLALSLPRSTRMRPIVRSSIVPAEAGAPGSLDPNASRFMTCPPSPREPWVVRAPEPSDVSAAPPRAEHREHREAENLGEVRGGADIAIERLQQEPEADRERDAESQCHGQVQPRVRAHGFPRHPCRIDHRAHAALVDLAFHLALRKALDRGVVGALGVLHVAREHRELAARVLQLQDFGALLIEGGAQTALALAGGARAGEMALRGRAARFPELALQALELGDRCLILRVVRADPLRELAELRLALGDALLERLHDRAREDFRRRVARARPEIVAQLLLACPGLVGLALRRGELRRQVDEPRVLHVDALVARQNPLLLLEFRELRF